MKNIVWIGLSIILITGCGAEVAYKRGAGARDLQTSKAICAKAGDEKALEKCLEANGWAVQKIDGSGFSDEELFATVSIADDNRMTAPKGNSKDTMQTTSSLNAEKVVIKADENTQNPDIKPINKTTSPSTSTSSASTPNTSTITTVKPSSPVSSIPAVAKPKPSLFNIYVIKSWWKMGGNATILEANMDECSTKLGEAHYPNKKTFTFTKAFAICLRKEGWRGLIERE
mgnify:CR=1 FL=1|jgi:hypothetical protein|tara:strand:+ start:2493 stop:3179 length:687 start_codon:yes stop_codon:yes gene_type:complete